MGKVGESGGRKMEITVFEYKFKKMKKNFQGWPSFSFYL